MNSVTNSGRSDLLVQKPARRTKTFARRIRDLHLYLGTFFAPAILFFAFTGALQTLGLHEQHPGEKYQPPAWLRTLAQLHKKQMTQLPPPRPEGASRAREQRRVAPTPQLPAGNTVSRKLMEWFVFAMALGLIGTTLLGVYMAYAFSPSKGVTSSLLVGGVLVPILILFV